MIYIYILIVRRYSGFNKKFMHGREKSRVKKKKGLFWTDLAMKKNFV